MSLKASGLIFWILGLHIRILAPVKTEFEKSLKWLVKLSPRRLINKNARDWLLLKELWLTT